jgi:putative membrane protein
MIIRYALASAAALALAACGGANDTAEAPAAGETMADATGGAPDPGTPQGFVDLAASSGMYEVEAGRLAQDLGSSQEVKDFGAMMVEDHTASSEQLSAAVVAGGAPLAVPPQMQPRHQQQLDALRAAGDDFDGLYLQQQVAAHEEALALLQGQARSGTVEPLREFAAEAAPVVEGHLEQVRELADEAGGGA